MPEEFIGKEVEVLAFELTEDTSTKNKLWANQSKEDRMQYLRETLEPYRVDLCNFTFDRDEANNYD